ncbi:MAG: hypothetical protein BGO67_03990 [Alphaproteobacteria bacterium 41-28]|nr:MAG: hypothetical protein BGO67_03990 [Alphaproteobacteria bacterium 41-28]
MAERNKYFDGAALVAEDVAAYIFNHSIESPDLPELIPLVLKSLFNIKWDIFSFPSARGEPVFSFEGIGFSTYRKNTQEVAA